MSPSLFTLDRKQTDILHILHILDYTHEMHTFVNYMHIYDNMIS
jgi:hypothetical protein